MENKKYIASTAIISTNAVCSNCPSKIYCKDTSFIRLGLTNVHAPNMLIVPTYNTDKEDDWNPIPVIEKLYSEITNQNIYDDYYITREIKCNHYNDYNIAMNSVGYCFNILWWEIFVVKPMKIIVVGCDKISYMLTEHNIPHIHICHWKNANFNSEFITAI